MQSCASKTPTREKHFAVTGNTRLWKCAGLFCSEELSGILLALAFGNLFSHIYQRLQRWKLGPVEANGITGSHRFLLYPSVKKKWGFLISWQHLCHTTRTPAGGFKKPNKSFFHQPQTPVAVTHPIPSYFHYAHPRGPETESRKSQENQGGKQESPVRGQRC